MSVLLFATIFFALLLRPGDKKGFSRQSGLGGPGCFTIEGWMGNLQERSVVNKPDRAGSPQ